MQGARIAVFEDDPSHRELLREAAELSGHEVVLEADSLRFALESLDMVAQKCLSIDAYILDGNLGVERDGYDARVIAQRMGELGLRGLRIGYSANEYPVPVDFDSRKDAFAALDFIGTYEVRDERRPA